MVNPFKKITVNTKKDNETREAFTEAELSQIAEGIRKGVLHSDICGGLFIVGLYTGLRRGDVCTLKWSEIRFTQDGGWITRKMNKTKNSVSVPMLPALRNYLLGEYNAAEDTTGYVFPKAAEIYLKKSETSISQYIKLFLRECGIDGLTKKVEGRTRTVSKKDFHSLRHSFVVICAIHGIPLNVIAQLVGHLTPKMTELYAAHATEQDKIQFMARLNNALPSVDKDVIDVCAERVGEDSRIAAQKILDNMTENELQDFLRVYGKKLQ